MGGLQHFAGVGHRLLHNGDVAFGCLLLEHLGFIFGVGLAGVEDQAHGLELRVDLACQIELLAHRVGADRADHIWLVLTHGTRGRARAGTPGIGAIAENHRSGCWGHLHGGLQGRCANRQDHVHLVAHKLLHHQGGVGQLAGGILLDEVDVFARDVASFCQGRFKAFAGVGWRRGFHHLQHADGGAFHLGATAELAAGGEHHRAHSAGPYQAQKFTTLKTHLCQWKTAAQLWRRHTSPAMRTG